MNLGEINILDVVSAVVVPNLPARPVHAFDLDDLAIFNLAREGD